MLRNVSWLLVSLALGQLYPSSSDGSFESDVTPSGHDISDLPRFFFDPSRSERNFEMLQLRFLSDPLIMESYILDQLDGATHGGPVRTRYEVTKGEMKSTSAETPTDMYHPSFEEARDYFGDWTTFYDDHHAAGSVGTGFFGGRASPGSPGVPFHICVPARSGSSKMKALMEDLAAKQAISEFRGAVLPARLNKEFFKLVLVRNPIIRALSGWAMWRGIQERESRGNGTCTNTQCNMPATFAEMARSLQTHSTNIHWAKQSTACTVANHFDFVGHVEDRVKWEPHFFAYTNLASSMDVADFVGEEPSPDEKRKAVLDIWCKHITREAFEQAASFYHDDIDSLGYHEQINDMKTTLETECWQ
jgi:hypothetical protein